MDKNLRDDAISRNLLNFFVLGQPASGAGLVSRTIQRYCSAERNRVHIHGHVFDLSKRTQAYADYFVDKKFPLPESSPTNWDFLTYEVFDQPLFDEKALGVFISYQDFSALDLIDLCVQRAEEGDFAVIDIKRNPIVSLVAARERQLRDGLAVSPVLTAKEIITAVDTYCRIRMQMDEARWPPYTYLAISQRQLIYDFDGCLARIVDFLNVPVSYETFVPPTARSLQPLATRLLNWDDLVSQLPGYVRAYMDEQHE